MFAGYLKIDTRIGNTREESKKYTEEKDEGRIQILKKYVARFRNVIRDTLSLKVNACIIVIYIYR